MYNYYKFGIIGGDKRSLYLAKTLLKDGHEVKVAGFEQASLDDGFICSELDEVAQMSYIVLPIPVTRDFLTLNAPFSEKAIPLDNTLAVKLSNSTIFCGLKQRLRKTSEHWKMNEIQDYYTREELTVKNAIITAEGAIQMAMNHLDITLDGARCLVIGFGRIGKSLSQMLRGIGADVTVSARKPADLEWIRFYGHTAVHTNKLGESIGEYQVIFNTVPSIVLQKSVLKKVSREGVIIELASLPGGIDLAVAEKFNLPVVHAQSLPSVTAPRTAAEIIKTTIYNMIEEASGR